MNSAGNGSHRRGLIKVTLHITEPWAVGGVSSYDFSKVAKREDEPTIYLPILKDPRDGSAHIPAASLVGSLRSHLSDPESLSDPERWLGSDNGPSAVRALGTQIGGAPVVTRTATTIDGARRAAKAKELRTEELVEASTTVHWWLQLERDIDVDEIDVLAGELWSWRPVIGRRRSVGRGRAEVTSVERGTVDLRDPVGLTWWLQHRHGFLTGSAHAPKPKDWDRAKPSSTMSSSDAPWKRSWLFEVVDPLHIGADRAPGDKPNHHPTGEFVPGSSWRGIFRHRIAHIQRMRSATESDVEATLDRLFGSGRKKGASAHGGHRGLLSFFDSPIDRGGRPLLTFTHVAIDRVTGGARQFSEVLDDRGKGALFTVSAIPSGARLTLDVKSETELSPADAELLDAVVADIDDGLVGVGAMTTRGYGTLELAEEQP